jgi:hypothetical protein
VLCREETGRIVASTNHGIRRVNAALIICDTRPPPGFSVSAPLALKEHLMQHRHVLQAFETATNTADTISWTKDAADTQAQLLTHHYYVRSSAPLLIVYSSSKLFLVRSLRIVVH